MSEELKTKSQVICGEAKAKFLKHTEQFAIYQKSFLTEKPLFAKIQDILSLQNYTG